MMLESRSSLWSGVRACGVLLLAVAAFAFVSALALCEDAIRSTLSEGGAVGPGGVEVACDVPMALRHRNTVGTDGSGLCVFWSLTHSSRYQNERRLWDFAEKMQSEPGGGYPEKVDRMIAKYGNGTRYVQHTGGDLEFLYAAIRTGRPLAVTYDGRDMHYGPRTRVAHMVNLVHLDEPSKKPRLAAILDNNFPGENQLVWMTADEFADRWRGNGGGWAVVLLSAPPPPVPSN